MMIFLFPRWDRLVLRRVYIFFFKGANLLLVLGSVSVGISKLGWFKLARNTKNHNLSTWTSSKRKVRDILEKGP